VFFLKYSKLISIPGYSVENYDISWWAAKRNLLGFSLANIYQTV